MIAKPKAVIRSSFWWWGLLFLTLVISVLALTGRSIAQTSADMPLQFKFIGKFYDPEIDENAGGVNRFTVNVLKKTWILDIESSHTLEGTALGSSILKQIYPPIMTFVGAKPITDQLTDPAIAGKTYTLTGQLYVNKRMYRVSNLEGPAEEEASEADDQAGTPEGPGTALP